MGRAYLCGDCLLSPNSTKHRRLQVSLRSGAITQKHEGSFDMNQFDPESFEAELRELKPSRVPDEFIKRMEERLSPSTSQLPPRGNRPSPGIIRFQNIWRWLVPASAIAAAVVAILFLRAPTQSARPQQTQTAFAAATPALEADNVEMAQELVASFDAVGHLPTGE